LTRTVDIYVNIVGVIIFFAFLSLVA